MWKIRHYTYFTVLNVLPTPRTVFFLFCGLKSDHTTTRTANSDIARANNSLSLQDKIEALFLVSGTFWFVCFVLY